MKRIVVALLLCIAGPAVAQVYKCKDGNTTVFSSTPCAVEARPIDVRPASGASRQSSASPTTTPATAEATGSQRNMMQRADDAARRRILDDEIWRKQRALDGLHDELSLRQTQLRNKKTWATNNLAGAVWEQSISDEMQAVAAEYDIKIRKATKEIDELKAKRAQIP